MVQKERLRRLNAQTESTGSSVAYWMSRDQRVEENWALLFAQELAVKNDLPLIVFFVLAPSFPGATLRHYDFMLQGLREVGESLSQYNIPFVLKLGDPITCIPQLIKDYDIQELVTDFSPLRIGKDWRNSISESIDIPMYEVDAHNIIPVWEASPKQEFAAYTIRPKIQKKLDRFLLPFPKIHVNHLHNIPFQKINWDHLYGELLCDTEVKPVTWITPGESAAKHILATFIETKLNGYDELRNNPNEDGQSNLSPYLHFGQLSAQFVTLEVQKSNSPQKDKDAFLEELIVRRELSDNYCYYNAKYDSYDGFPDWAKKTLQVHLKDTREYLYSKEEFENAKTHDEIWNTAQMEMVKKGKMHGYMRMYWAKKILEWSESAKEAMRIAVYLNDKYQLDGRDPNGYVGCAWSIGGVHDRAWFERPVYGKIRYMNANGLKRKFDVKQYLKNH